MKIPFLDLPAQHIPLRAELDAAMGEVIDQCAFAGGPFVTRFEEEFAAFCNAKYAIGVGNGTDALWLSLLAADVGPGDEVITVPNTFMATAEAISYTGAKPVLVDVHPRTLSLNPELLEAAITKKTRAIIPVHLFGQTADMDPILAIAKKHGVPVIEDACQAHGAEYKGRKAGTMGITGCFSFYPGKNLGALGEAGAVTTEDPEIYQKIKVLREHGQPRKYHHSMIGWNARMDGIQAAALRVKLKHLAKWNTQRRSHARQYDQLLEGLEGATLPVEAPFARHVYHLYPVQVPNRDLVLKLMADHGISCGIHYPVPVHLQEAYRQLELGVGSFPVSEQSALSLISLPMYPELSQDQIAYVASTFRRVVAMAREHEYAA